MSKRRDDPVPFHLPPDFKDRCRETNARIEAGEPMTYEHLANALGLPFEFIAASMSVAEVLATGRPVLIDPAQPPKSN